jgi:predicted NAD/FAD-binding protein
MRIGIIGGGASGLITAWLLQQNHQVTLFEKQDRLGGHANTIEIESKGERIGIDAGFEFFSDVMFPRFNRLLHLLNVPVSDYLLRVCVYRTDNDPRKAFVLPPINGNKIIWSGLASTKILTLLQLQYLLLRAKKVINAADPYLTIDNYLNRHWFTRSARNDLIDPILLAGWCLEIEDFKQFSAYDVLKYFVLNKPDGITSPRMREIVGGTQTYVQALAGALTRSHLKLSSNICRITRPDGRNYIIEEQDGSCHEFDHVVVATNAYEAREVLIHLDQAAEARQILGQVEYFKSTIAIHGDKRLMPKNEKYWSEANIRYDERHSSHTIWKGWKSKEPIFRSWVTFEEQLPQRLYALTTYYHPKVNANYFKAQAELARLQGQNKLWFVGVYTYDIDCHESAVISAIKVAQQLDPASTNLGQLVL